MLLLIANTLAIPKKTLVVAFMCVKIVPGEIYIVWFQEI